MTIFSNNFYIPPSKTPKPDQRYPHYIPLLAYSYPIFYSPYKTISKHSTSIFCWWNPLKIPGHRIKSLVAALVASLAAASLLAASLAAALAAASSSAACFVASLAAASLVVASLAASWRGRKSMGSVMENGKNALSSLWGGLGRVKEAWRPDMGWESQTWKGLWQLEAAVETRKTTIETAEEFYRPSINQYLSRSEIIWWLMLSSCMGEFWANKNGELTNKSWL